MASAPDTASSARRAAIPLAVACACLIVAGLAGLLTAAWGYAFFLLTAGLFTVAMACGSVLAFGKAGDTAVLVGLVAVSIAAGIACYAFALSSFAGFFAYETLQGRMEWKWILFGPLALASIVVLDKGLYAKLVRNNLPTWRRFRQYISRDQADPRAMRRTFVDDVILHRNLYAVSRLRWWRHTLIYWGFVAMVVLELFAVFVREALPAFGLRDIWREPGHPVRLAFDAAFDLTGLMLLAGCLLALAWRIRVNGKPEQKFSDTPTTLFLLVVVVSGFVVEGMRLQMLPGTGNAASFVGVAFGWALAALPNGALYEPLWLAHVVAACGFIAYVPVKRLVHTCATPMGRLMNSQKALLAARKYGVLRGLAGRQPAPTAAEAPLSN